MKSPIKRIDLETIAIFCMTSVCHFRLLNLTGAMPWETVLNITALYQYLAIISNEREEYALFYQNTK